MRKLEIRQITLAGVMIALVCVLTMWGRVMFIPATEGYIHLGDVMANFVALSFGPWLGLVAAGVGMAIADAIGFPLYIVPTLIVHGLQGLVVGYVGSRKDWPTMVVAAVIGQLIVMGGYFLVQALLFGIAPALTELPWNGLQGLVGVVGGVLLVLLVRRAYPPITQWAQPRTWQE